MKQKVNNLVQSLKLTINLTLEFGYPTAFVVKLISIKQTGRKKKKSAFVKTIYLCVQFENIGLIEFNE